MKMGRDREMKYYETLWIKMVESLQKKHLISRE